MPVRRSLPFRSARRSAAAVAAAALVVAGLTTSGAQASAVRTSAAGVPAARSHGVKNPAISENGPQPFTQQASGLPDVDTRGVAQPTATQRSAVPAGATVRWNRYGTPESLLDQGGYLSGPSAASPTRAARGWLRNHAALFGVPARTIDRLQLVNDTPLNQSKARVVLFRQHFGTLPAAVDGLVTVGLAPDGRVAYVSSSFARTSRAPASPTMRAVQAWKHAAVDVHLPNLPDLSTVTGTLDPRTGWTIFRAPGLPGLQRVRLRALALADGRVRPVFEANVVDLRGAASTAYTSYVDAVTGAVLVRHNQVDNLGVLPMTTSNEPFQGTITATECGPDHTFSVDASTKTIIVSASAAEPTNDIVLSLVHNGNVVASSDTATSPESITYPVPAGQYGDYKVQVCPFKNPTVPFTQPGNYGGVFTASDQAPNPSTPYPPEWKYFLSNPVLNFSKTDTTDNRAVGCWVIPDPTGACMRPPSPLNNLAARAPWDYDFRTNQPSDTTKGNAAFTGEAWLSPLTPGGGHQMPVSPNRHYGFDNQTPSQNVTDAWNNTQCDPAQLTPGGNDILAAVTNLFAGHNRMHDFSYFLGFTEAHYNLQDTNFGLTAPGPYPAGGEGDPEVGDVQAGAVDGGYPSFLGRDNANQITLQDGVPGITNQYLFQPIAGAFYSPCVDGDFDASVYGHEYTHAISNRMVAGPDGGLSGYQAGSMGESWSDQVALEYLFEHHYSLGTKDPWVEGPYVTDNKVVGIRNYALDKNPLQYGDLGYDVTGPEVHADGEVWSAAMFDVRRQLVAKYNARYPQSDQRLELRCSDGVTSQQPPATPLPAGQCPGGRRWVQLTFDAFLLQQSGTSMLDARDAYLAADKMRFDGQNQAAIWRGFASDGMGQHASTTSTADVQPISDYTSQYAKEATVKIKALGFSSNGQVPVSGKLYVGRYEARVTPSADTNSATSRPNVLRLVPGTYDFVYQADGYGLYRFHLTVRAGQTYVREIHVSRNVASSHSGASVDGSSPGLNATKLIDDTEASNWAGTEPTGVSVDTPTQHPFVNVNLAGGRQLIRSIKVSAMLRPADPAQDENPNMPDKSSGSRFTALRKFAIEVCTESATSNCSSVLPSTAAGSPYTRIYTSPADAFNGVRPRPTAPALLLKRFDIPDTMATHVRLVALENQCTGQAGFAGEQDADPTNATDCKAASTRDESVRAAELEVFGYDTHTRPPGDPIVMMHMTGKQLAAPGESVTYTLTYSNLGPNASSTARIRVPKLPVGLRFVSASGRSSWSPTDRSLLWRLGTVPVGATRSVTVTTKVAGSASPGTTMLTQAQFSGVKTYSPPAAAATVVSR